MPTIRASKAEPTVEPRRALEEAAAFMVWMLIIMRTLAWAVMAHALAHSSCRRDLTGQPSPAPPTGGVGCPLPEPVIICYL